jgi:hypothetical protein
MPNFERRTAGMSQEELEQVDEPLREAEEGAAVCPDAATVGALLVLIAVARSRLRTAARSLGEAS